MIKEINLTEEQKRILDLICEEFNQLYERNKIRAMKEIRDFTLAMTNKTVIACIKQQYGLDVDNIYLKSIYTDFQKGSIKNQYDYILQYADIYYTTYTLKD